MSETRKRQIIRHAAPEEGAAVLPDALEYDDYSREGIFAKRVQLPLPVILMGFMTIIFVSITLTYVAVKWPAPGLNLSENEFMSTLEALAIPEVLPQLNPEIVRPQAVAAPLADLSVPGDSTRFAGLEQNRGPGDVALKSFVPASAANVPAPVADLTISPRLDPTLRPRQGGQALPVKTTWPGVMEVDGVDEPVAILTLSSQIFEPPQERAADLSQKLMQRRYADAVTAPELEADDNPLLRPVTGGRLPVKTAALLRVGETASPVADLILPPREPVPALGRSEGIRIREANLTAVTNIEEPVARLNLPAREVEANVVAGEGLETRQPSLTTALGADEPVVLLILPARDIETVEQPLEGLETRTANLAEALGVGNPVALLNLPAREIGVLGDEITLPSQKLMQRRYARAVTNPELQETVPTPSVVIIPRDQGTSLLADEAEQPWRRYAARVPADAAGKPKIVIIIDDMGNNSAMARAFSGLPGPLTFAFLPYAPNLERQTGAIRAAGHELLVHLPMEPTGNETPGPHALLTSLSAEQVLEVVDWNLSQFEGFVGVNNHMGSRFTKDRVRMALVMGELQRRGLLFLDSRTVANSEGARLAQSLGMPWAGRDIFLDNEVNDAAILAQLMKVERLARSRGLAIAIGHPHVATFRVLEQWIATLEIKGFVLVPLSSVVEFNPNPKLAEAGQ